MRLAYVSNDQRFALTLKSTDLGVSDYVDTDEPNLSHWANACPPDSPLRLAESGKVSSPTSQSQHSYIFDHPKAMDVCQNPDIVPLHGFTATPGTNLGELVPLFTFSKTNLHSDILATPLEQYSTAYKEQNVAWEDKPHNKLLWRGSTTGIEFTKDREWKESQRFRMHLLGHGKKGSKTVFWADERGQQLEATFDVSQMNQHYLVSSDVLVGKIEG